jgi:hypothetical protein
VSKVPSLGGDSGVSLALADVYRVFDTPAPSVIEGCPCCIETRGVDVLLTTPLRQISGDALWRYATGVFLTVGGEQDFRYLLPRILEISVADPGFAIGPEVVLGKLRLANWRSWSAKEQLVVEALVDAWFGQALANDIVAAKADDLVLETESVLCGAARADMPLGRWLARLQEEDAAQVLAYMRVQFLRGLSGFWDDAPTGAREMSAILTGGAQG